MNLSIPATGQTPKIDFNLDTKKLEIFGASFPENPKAWYQQLFNWLNENQHQIQPGTELLIQLEYISNGTFPQVEHLVNQLKAPIQNGLLTVKWRYYDHDEEILDQGHLLEQHTEVPIEFIAYATMER